MGGPYAPLGFFANNWKLAQAEGLCFSDFSLLSFWHVFTESGVHTTHTSNFVGVLWRLGGNFLYIPYIFIKNVNGCHFLTVCPNNFIFTQKWDMEEWNIFTKSDVMIPTWRHVTSYNVISRFRAKKVLTSAKLIPVRSPKCIFLKRVSQD